MAQSSMVGSRIRERRVLAGIKQSDLAGRAGISPSYLNLIEHNRRRIGGKRLLQLAEALEVDAAWLSEGAEATLIAGLHEAAGADTSQTVELDRIEEFASRFPGWAGLLTETARRAEGLEQTVQALTDRLAHDPQLAASLHEVISMVTAIRSTASILADTKELKPEWRARFNRNINEDSRRLAEGAEDLVRYLEGAPDKESEIRSPQDELHAFLAAQDYHIAALEGGEGDVADLIANSPALVSDAARSLTHDALEQYARDAAALPMSVLQQAIDDHGLRPDRLLDQLDVGAGCLFRRLAGLPMDVFGPVGLVICDATGTLVYRKPLPGFDIPSAAGACALWPLYQALGTPAMPQHTMVVQSGRGHSPMQSYSMAEHLTKARFNQPASLRAYMLLLPAPPGIDPTQARAVGTTCRVCPTEGCVARREPSILAKGF